MKAADDKFRINKRRCFFAQLQCRQKTLRAITYIDTQKAPELQTAEHYSSTLEMYKYIRAMFFTFSILTIAGDGLLGWIDSWPEPVCPFLCFLHLLCRNGICCLQALNYMVISFVYFQSSEGKQVLPSCWGEDSCINQQESYEYDKYISAFYQLN